jgi:hypothetical protein
MKKIAWVLIPLLFLACSVHRGFADETTPRLGLTVPSLGTTSYAPKINNDLVLIDSGTAILGKDNVFTATNTFNGNFILGSPLSLTYGGTGQNWSAVTIGRIPYFSGTGTMSTLAAGTTGQILVSGGSAAPVWTSTSALSVGSASYSTSAGSALTASTATYSVNSATATWVINLGEINSLSSTGDVTITADSESDDDGDVVINAGTHEMARFEAGNDPNTSAGTLSLNTRHLYVTNTENATTFDITSSTDGTGVIASAMYGDDPALGSNGSVGMYFGNSNMIYMDYLYGDGESEIVEAAMRADNGSYRLTGSTANITANMLVVQPASSPTFGVVISSNQLSTEEMMAIVPRGKLDVRGDAFIDTTLNVGTTTVSGSTLTVNGRIESLAGGFKFPDGTTQTTAASGSGGGDSIYPATSTVMLPYGINSGAAGGSLTVAISTITSDTLNGGDINLSPGYNSYVDESYSGITNRQGNFNVLMSTSDPAWEPGTFAPANPKIYFKWAGVTKFTFGDVGDLSLVSVYATGNVRGSRLVSGGDGTESDPAFQNTIYGGASNYHSGMFFPTSGSFRDVAFSVGNSEKFRVTSTGISINSGTAITGHLSGTASLDFGATAAGTCDSLTITVTGAADGDTVNLGIPTALAGSDTYQSFDGYVSSANTVTVKRCNLLNVTTALSNPAAATVRADVWKH